MIILIIMIFIYLLYVFDFSKIFLDSIFINSKDFLLIYTNFTDVSKNELMNILSIWLEHFHNDVSVNVIKAIIDYCFINHSLEDISSNTVNVLGKASNINKFKSEIQNNTLLLNKLMGMFIFYFYNGTYIVLNTIF